MSDLAEIIERSYFPEPMSGCWIWMGTLSSHGYARISFGGRKLVASRVSFEIHKGKIPDGMQACHHCDNPTCINPDHLFAGTSKDNMQDMSRKGRGTKYHWDGRRRADNNPKAKLTWADVDVIRSSILPPKVLAANYGVGYYTIIDIRLVRTWKDRP